MQSIDQFILGVGIGLGMLLIILTTEVTIKAKYYTNSIENNIEVPLCKKIFNKD